MKLGCECTACKRLFITPLLSSPPASKKSLGNAVFHCSQKGAGDLAHGAQEGPFQRARRAADRLKIPQWCSRAGAFGGDCREWICAGYRLSFAVTLATWSSYRLLGEGEGGRKHPLWVIVSGCNFWLFHVVYPKMPKCCQLVMVLKRLLERWHSQSRPGAEDGFLPRGGAVSLPSKSWQPGLLRLCSHTPPDKFRRQFLCSGSLRVAGARCWHRG